MRRLPVVGTTLWVVLLSSSGVVLVTPALAQTATPPAPQAKHKPNPYGSPLDTIMSTHLWADVPAAKDFVKETRPSPKDLTYTPLTGQDPERPKPRDAANVMALQAELEEDAARNKARAQSLLPKQHPPMQHLPKPHRTRRHTAD